MWYRSMTNVRPLQLVIVMIMGHYLRHCVWVGGGVEGWETDRRRAICRTLICESQLSVEVRSPAEPISALLLARCDSCSQISSQRVSPPVFSVSPLKGFLHSVVSFYQRARRRDDGASNSPRCPFPSHCEPFSHKSKFGITAAAAWEAFNLPQILLISLMRALCLLICPCLHSLLKAVLGRLYINSLNMFSVLPSYLLYKLSLFSLTDSSSSVLCSVSQTNIQHVLLFHN